MPFYSPLLVVLPFSLLLLPSVFSLFWTSSSNATIYPLCKKYKDNTRGEWIETSNIITPEQQREVAGHFYGEPGEALQFSNVWLPRRCSYHRFTVKSLNSLIKQIIEENPSLFPEKILHLGVFGDSGTRNAICGLSRLMAGSEIIGPCRNRVCGTERQKRISVEEAYQPYEIKFSSKFKITFYYIFGFNSRSKETFSVLHRFLDHAKVHPYAIILNTGIYDFVKSPTYGQSSFQGCDSIDQMERAINRARPEVMKELASFSAIAKKKKIRLIYRTNHVNKRYGALCADGLLEVKMKEMKESIWEIWDNRALSKDIWRKQTCDGFHYGRARVHSIEDHKRYRKEYYNKFHEYPGQLEMQYVQSLLHNLFYEFLLKNFNIQYGNLLKNIQEEDDEEEDQNDNEMTPFHFNATTNAAGSLSNNKLQGQF